ncbi:MAG: AAA-like domain-containing protein, partial [Pseudomonadota bacterium]
MTGDSDSKPVRDTDATGEFFSVGAPLHAVRAGYIPRRADDLLFEAVTAGRYAHVLAPNRTGKSSLIAAVSARVESANIRVATLDLKQIAPKESDTDVGRWFYNLAYRLLRQLRIRMDLQEWWQDKALLTNRQRLFEFYAEIILPQIDGNIVVFVDSLMAIEGPKFAPPLLASVRAAHDARVMDPDFQRLTFVLVGECDPVDLIDDPMQSPFNVSQAINLRDFDRNQLDLFATELNLAAEDAK